MLKSCITLLLCSGGRIARHFVPGDPLDGASQRKNLARFVYGIKN
jgi:hypothetical protein